MLPSLSTPPRFIGESEALCGRNVSTGISSSTDRAAAEQGFSASPCASAVNPPSCTTHCAQHSGDISLKETSTLRWFFVFFFKACHMAVIKRAAYILQIFPGRNLPVSGAAEEGV